MMKKKSRGTLGKVVVGASLAAAAGAAAVAANKKTRDRMKTKAKKAVNQLKTDARAKEIGYDTADLLSRIGDAIKNFFK